jgi:hypothetical protein
MAGIYVIAAGAQNQDGGAAAAADYSLLLS